MQNPWLDLTIKWDDVTADHSVYVSTVRLPGDYNVTGVGPPQIFQTAIIGGPLAYQAARWATIEEALAGHAAMLARAKQAAAMVA